MRESNSHQRFWRPLSYHLTNPLSKPTCKISFTVAIIHIKATIVKLIVHFYYKEFYKERAEMEGFEPSHRLPGLPHFEGRETAKTPYISAQVRIKYVPKACKKGLFSYLVICVRMTLQLHFSRPGTIWAPRAPFRTRRTHE